MKLKNVVLFLSLALSTQSSFGQQYSYHWGAGERQIFQLIHELQLDSARAAILQQEKSAPKNLILPYLNDYVDFYTLFITEDYEQYQALADLEKKRVNLMKQGPTDDPNHLLLQAEIMVHWAMLKAKFEEYASAAVGVNRAFKLLKKNEAKFPKDMATKRMISTIRSGVGTIPKKYMWIVKALSSLEGSVEGGIKGLQEVYAHGQDNEDFIYQEESLMLMTIISTHFGNQATDMHGLLTSIPCTYDKQPLIVFAKASVAQEADDNEYVISLLENRKIAKGQLPFYYLDYILGLAKLARLDDDASEPLMNFVSQFEGQNYIKEAYQKLAWHGLLTGNPAAYNLFIQKAKTEGFTVVDADKQALKEANVGKPPFAPLLRARLLSDGGYLDRAKKELDGLEEVASLTTKQQLEHTYRKGRVAQAAKDYPLAIASFKMTIDDGRDAGFYFACNAALQLGRIYESKDNVDKARQYFQTCLDISSDEYENSLHQKAKAGLDRLKDK